MASIEDRLDDFEFSTQRASRIDAKGLSVHWFSPSEPTERTIPRALRAQVQSVPDQPHILMGEDTWTFTRVDAVSNVYAHELARLGVGHGDPVVAIMDTSVEVCLLAYAVFKLGAIWMPLSTELNDVALNRALETSKSSVLISDPKYVESCLASPSANAFSHVLVAGAQDQDLTVEDDRLVDCNAFDLSADVNAPPNDNVHFTDPATVLWTSGTTGPPKGVTNTHHAWMFHVPHYTRHRDVRDGDVFYNCLPLYNAGGWIMGGVFASLVTGLPMALDATFSVSEFWDRVRRYEATHAATLGAMHMYLWQADSRTDDADNPLRSALMVPLPSDIVEQFKSRFGIEFVLSLSGNSECMGWAFAGKEGDWSADSCGFPPEHFDVRLFDDNDYEVPVGEIGEICVRQREPWLLFDGYWENPAATNDAFRNQWYHSGDYGRFNERGELFFEGRKAQFMRHKGRNVSAFEVEEVALAHPAVREAVAHGVPSEELESEDEIKLCVVLRSAIGPQEIAQHFRERAPKYMVPKYIEILDELPRTGTGKTAIHELQQRGITASTWVRSPREDRLGGDEGNT